MDAMNIAADPARLLPNDADDFVGGARLIAEAGKLAGTSPAGVLGRLSDTPSDEADRLKRDRLRPEYVKYWAYSGFE